MAGIRTTIRGLKYRLRGLPREARWYSGLGHSLLQGAGARILVYHGICQGDHLRYNTIFLRQSVFESQLRLFKKYCNIISLDDCYAGRYDDSRFNLCLTFDDGFANNSRYVLPLLEQYQVPATFFITSIRETGYEILWNDLLAIAAKHGPAQFRLGEDAFHKGKNGQYISMANGMALSEKLRATGFEEKKAIMEILDPVKEKAHSDYWMQLSSEQIKELAASTWVSIGSHGAFHNDLARLPIEVAAKEMSDSKNFLETLTGKEVRSISFPYGSYTREVKEAAKRIGYTQLLGTAFISADDKNDAMMKERLIINPFISNINQLYAGITGHYR